MKKMLIKFLLWNIVIIIYLNGLLISALILMAKFLQHVQRQAVTDAKGLLNEYRKFLPQQESTQ
jgi:hypothetical protein